jgi:Mg2+ and Co2+ transporter CorA
MQFYQFPLSTKSLATVQRLDAPPADKDAQAEGFVWCTLARSELPQMLEPLQALVRSYSPEGLLQLHISDLVNAQHPSRYDYSSHYDVLIFSQLLHSCAEEAQIHGHSLSHLKAAPACFIVFDQLLITVYDDRADWGSEFLAKFMQDARLPHSPADLMLRLINAMVDEYLNLRKMLGLRLQHWQEQLLRSSTPFSAWSALLAERAYFNDLASVCEEQHDTMQEWLDSLLEQDTDNKMAVNVQRDLLLARCRDIIGHIQRVNQYVTKLETSMENAVQIHFSAQANRANAAMQVLTVIAAIFLPLNFVTGFFGMNFDDLPLIHHTAGVWLAVLGMLLAAAGMAWFFWRKRYWMHHDKT